MTSSGVEAAIVDRVAAVVNDDVITLSEVYELGEAFIDERVASGGDPDVLRREAELEVLDSLILRRLISQEILSMGLEVQEPELDRAIDDIAQRNNMERAQLRGEIEGSGLAWSAYREEVRESLRQYKFNEAVIRPRIAVDENELVDAYKRSTTTDGLPVIAELGALFFKLPPSADDATREAVLAKARAARTRVASGEDFSAVATEVDEGLFGSQGGKMGTFQEGELVGDLDKAAFALQQGRAVGAGGHPQGVFVLMMLTRTVQEPPAFEDVRRTSSPRSTPDGSRKRPSNVPPGATPGGGAGKAGDTRRLRAR